MYSKIIYLFIIITFISCNNKEQKQINLSKQDYYWQPYKKNDLLVFESNKGMLDTLKVSKIELQNMPSDPLDILPTRIETLHVYVSKIKNGADDGFLHKILEVSPYKKDTTLVDYSFSFKTASFYNHDGSSEKKKAKENFGLREPVYVIISNDSTFLKRDNYVDKLYWSKSKGILGYDMRKGDKWRILKSQSSTFLR
ncbi:hypothetical protein [Tenacibaculum sp. 190524A05c]|uniref:Lipoprotein n=1 Tax=Tenacibaculum platacis TaxID=3137852 RepID=A0ABP1EPP0_9FLAO